MIDDKFRHAHLNLPLVISFSGGRTSGKMLHDIKKSGKQFITLFANTGKERDETLDFVHAVETNWDIPITWLEYTRIPTDPDKVALLKTERMRDVALTKPEMHWFKQVSYETAARHSDVDGPFDEMLRWATVLPNTRARICTNQLKVSTMRRYLWSVGITQYYSAIGIRADEADRAFDIINAGDRDRDVGLCFPLIDDNITEADVMQFWSEQPFDLQLKPYEGNCHLCFLKKKTVKQRLIKDHPELAQWWIDWEQRKKIGGALNGARWALGTGNSMLELKAAHNPDQWSVDDFVKSGMDCACTSGAMGSEIE